MISRNARGQTIRVHSYSAPMRKHGGDSHQKPLPGMQAAPKVAGPRVGLLRRRGNILIVLATIAGLK